MKTKARLVLFAALFSLLPSLGRSAPDARGDLLRRLNTERERLGTPALRLAQPLNQVAQQHAEEIARSGNLRLERGSERQVSDWIRKAGYNSHRWSESVTSSPDAFDQILHEWRRRDHSTWGTLMDAEVRDLGIGLSQLGGTPLYVFLFAVPEADHFARTTGRLRDPERVRAEMLAEVNALRRKAGAPELRMNAALEKAAQVHAQDMLDRGFFAHKSPSNTTVRERATKAGYKWRNIGENIAEGQRSVDEVLQTWMDSPGHRRNMLEPKFREIGIGLVTGKGRDGEYRVIWVQNFGAK